MNIKKEKIALEASLYAESYYDFFKAAFNQLEENTDFVDNWHYEYICDLLQSEVERIARKEPSKYDVIIFNVPPRSGKSYLIARLFNAWSWINYPWFRFVSASYSATLAGSHALDTRRIIKTDWYKQRFGVQYKIADDKDTQGRFDTSRGGMRFATSVGGTITGEGGHLIFVDDPLSPQQANSRAIRESVNEWFDNTFFSRINNQETGVRIVVMQRLHANDLTGYLLSKQSEDFRVKHINLPAKLTKEVDKDLIPFYENNNGYLFRNKFGEKELKKQKIALGPYDFAAQFMQKPSPEGGGKIRGKWFKRINIRELPTDLQLFYYTDPSEGKPDSDEMATGVWSIHEGQIYIRGMLSIVKSFPEFMGYRDGDKYIKKEYDLFVEKYGNNIDTMHFMEAKSLGQGYVDYMNKRTPYNAIGDNPGSMSKEARAYAAIPTIAAGNVILVETGNPHLDQWIIPFIEQVEEFPRGAEDGQVDVLASIVRKSNLTVMDDDLDEDEVDERLKEMDDVTF